MPIYEYECIQNKHRFEVIQKFSDPPDMKCTICGEPARRLLSAPAIQFKGSGWYITDYARKPEGKSDAKPEGGSVEKPSESASSPQKKESSDTSKSAETKS